MCIVKKQDLLTRLVIKSKQALEDFLPIATLEDIIYVVEQL